MLFTSLGETSLERGLLRLVTFRKYLRSLVKTSRMFSEKSAADLLNLHSLCTEELFEEKKDIMFWNNLILLQIFRHWAKSSGHFAVFFLQVCQISILHIENFFRENVYFLKLVLYFCFNSGETFDFWQAFEIFKLWHPVARWGKKLSLRIFFWKTVIGLWVK